MYICAYIQREKEKCAQFYVQRVRGRLTKRKKMDKRDKHTKRRKGRNVMDVCMDVKHVLKIPE
jgi:hypothetical protein